MVDANAGGPGGNNGRPPGMAAVAGGGAEFTVLVCVGLFAGQWLDRRLGTAPWLLIIGAFMGAAAGFYRLVRAITPARRRRTGAETGPRGRGQGGKGRGVEQ